MNEKNRAAGRSGVGAVMGSKKLKAIAVRGTNKIRLTDKEAFQKAVFQAKDMLRSAPLTSEALPA
jgi:aldehyde:ferredoxin oxidoreductase